MQIAPARETGTAQNATDGGRAESGGLCNVIGGAMLTAQFDHQCDLARRSGFRTAVRARGTIVQSGCPFAAIAADPLGCGFDGDVESGCGLAQAHRRFGDVLD